MIGPASRRSFTLRRYRRSGRLSRVRVPRPGHPLADHDPSEQRKEREDEDDGPFEGWPPDQEPYSHGRCASHGHRNPHREVAAGRATEATARRAPDGPEDRPDHPAEDRALGDTQAHERRDRAAGEGYASCQPHLANARSTLTQILQSRLLLVFNLPGQPPTQSSSSKSNRFVSALTSRVRGEIRGDMYLEGIRSLARRVALITSECLAAPPGTMG
jgi:hypothetical protein